MLDDYEARIAAGQVWVLDGGAGIAGVLVLEDTADGFLLDNIAISPLLQGKGHGRTLLDFAEQEARPANPSRSAGSSVHGGLRA